MTAADLTRPKGRSACDWEEAFQYWAMLPAGERSYAAVADRFSISTRTVERHGQDERWADRLAGIASHAAVTTNAQLAQ